MTDSESPTRSYEPCEGAVIDGKYRIVRLCGRGGMGAVYEALNVAIGKRVALKFIDPNAATNHDAVQRFLREAQAASAAESQHIVQVFDVGEHPPGCPYIVMELLRGETLAARLAKLGRLPISEAVHVAVHTLRGLRRAHEMGIIHRDLKPENVFLVETDDDPIFAKLVDFGISKILRQHSEAGLDTLTREGVILGTPYYMSPEQAQAAPDLDGRTDLWAVGAILYECLAGCRPHEGRTYEQVIVAICTVDVADVRERSPGVPQRLAETVKRALSRDRALRFQTADEFLEALRDAAPELISANPPLTDPSLDATLRSPPPGSGDAATPRIVPGASGRPVSSAGEPDLQNASGPRSWSRRAKRDAQGEPGKPMSTFRMAMLGAAVMLGAFAITLGIMHQHAQERREPERAIVAGAPSAAAPALVELRVIATPAQASVSVDTIAAPDAVVRGSAGSIHRVRIDAEGYRSWEQTLVLDGTVREMRVELTASADASDGADSGPMKVAAPTVRPAVTASATSKASAPPIVPGLKLKTDGP